MPRFIRIIHRIVQAIGIQVKSANIGCLFQYRDGRIVGVDESSGLGIVVSAVKVVKTGFSIKVITTITEGVDLCYMGIITAIFLKVNMQNSGENSPLLISFTQVLCIY